MVTDSITIINRWLNEVTFSAATWDLEAHMALISKDVRVLGVPRIEYIDYRGWKQRRHNEFKKKLLQSLTYREARLLHKEGNTLHFSVHETMRGLLGQCIEVRKEITLQLEKDGKWRAVKEQILSINVKKRA